MSTVAVYFFIFLIISPLFIIRYINISKDVSDEKMHNKAVKLFVFYAISSYILIVTGDKTGELELWRQVVLALIAAIGWWFWAWFVGVVVLILVSVLGFKID